MSPYKQIPPIRVSEEEYEEIMKAKKASGLTWRKVVRAGLGLTEFNELDDFKSRLKEYGYRPKRVLEALRYVYTAQAHDYPKTTGVPNDIMDDRYPNEVGPLLELGLLCQRGSGYRVTDSSRKIASAAIKEFLDSINEELRGTVNEFGKSLFSFLTRFGFTMERGNLSTSEALLDKPSFEFSKNKAVQAEYKDLKSKLETLGIGVTGPEGREMNLPIEFEDYLYTIPSLDKFLTRFEVYRVLIVSGRYPQLNTRKEVLDELRSISESDLEEEVNRLHEERITSRYVEKEPPFLINDRDALLDKIREEVEDELEKRQDC